ncbi:hemolysin D [Legionella birminghamensis]|uniref:Hemolysin D n=1 Tax=Legionella birminghamensis TaxID=28083 RepID=A0A378ILE8_9GAMM|nr:HlyD family secretion protein [Legionella birminghamensis]KTC66794.1 hemolysin D [Legionella birminghamensis]STX32944.1 hemolysin D [Legionella birminghamensis]
MRNLFSIILIAGSFLAGCNHSHERQIQGYVEGENIYLASPYSGILENLAVARGQLVKKGQLLFQLDKNPESLQIKQFEADLLQAKNVLKDLENPRRKPEIAAIQAQIDQTEAQIKLAQVRVRRYEELYRRNAASKDTLDEAVAVYQEQVKLKEQYESNLRLARLGSREEQINAQKAQIASFTERLAVAQWQLEQKRLYAPADGLIFDTYYRKGEFVGTQKAVLSLLTPANVRIEFFVPVEVLSNLKIGQKIEFLCQGCTTRSQALISYISPEAQYVPPLVYSRENTDKLVFRIKADLSQFNEYKLGQPVTVFIP